MRVTAEGMVVATPVVTATATGGKTAGAAKVMEIKVTEMGAVRITGMVAAKVTAAATPTAMEAKAATVTMAVVERGADVAVRMAGAAAEAVKVMEGRAEAREEEVLRVVAVRVTILAEEMPEEVATQTMDMLAAETEEEPASEVKTLVLPLVRARRLHQARGHHKMCQPQRHPSQLKIARLN
jgi:hypothetical protein